MPCRCNDSSFFVKMIEVASGASAVLSMEKWEVRYESKK